MMRVLLVEDDKRTSDYISNGLASSGHVIDVVPDGRDALAAGLREPYDIAIVDRMIPGLDGLSLVRSLRAAGGRLPIILLTAIDGVDERVEGL